MRRLTLGLVALLASSLYACGENCLLGACEDALVVEVTLPSEPASYLFTFSTEVGSTRCVLSVPLALDGPDCDDPNVVRWAPLGDDSTDVAAISVLNSLRAEVTVTRGDEALYAGEVSADPGSQVEAEGTAEYCGGPCQVSSASLDLSGQAP